MQHHVYFWLKDENLNDADRARFEAGLDALCQADGIVKWHWGKPALTAERPVTDHSFHYGLSLEFASLDAHDRYQDGDPVHDEFVSKFSPMFERALVMDLA